MLDLVDRRVGGVRLQLDDAEEHQQPDREQRRRLQRRDDAVVQQPRYELVDDVGLGQIVAGRREGVDDRVDALQELPERDGDLREAGVEVEAGGADVEQIIEVRDRRQQVGEVQRRQADVVDFGRQVPAEPAQ